MNRKKETNILLELIRRMDSAKRMKTELFYLEPKIDFMENAMNRFVN